MSLDEATEKDTIKEVDGISFIVDKRLDQEFDDLQIDFKRTMFRTGYIITLRNGRAACV